jgi:hypothetical protein
MAKILVTIRPCWLPNWLPTARYQASLAALSVITTLLSRTSTYLTTPKNHAWWQSHCRGQGFDSPHLHPLNPGFQRLCRATTEWSTSSWSSRMMRSSPWWSGCGGRARGVTAPAPPDPYVAFGAAPDTGGRFVRAQVRPAGLGFLVPFVGGGCSTWGNTDESQFDVNEGFRRGEPMH